MAEATDREDYKERLRAAGRRALEDFRRQKTVRARGLAVGAGPGSSSAQDTDRSPTVELATFRVVTQPAAATAARPAAPFEPAELRLLTPAACMTSTSLGALPPGSAFLLPEPAWGHNLASSPACSVASGTGGAASISSLASSAAAGFATPPPSVAGSAGASVYVDPGPGLGGGSGGRHVGRTEEGESRLPADVSPRNGPAGRAAATDTALVDMLLAQVESLMREKAALAGDNAGLRQQVEQLTELVGYLMLEREEGEAEGSGGEGEAPSLHTVAELGPVGEEEPDSSARYGLPQPSLAPLPPPRHGLGKGQGLSEWQGVHEEEGAAVADGGGAVSSSPRTDTAWASYRQEDRDGPGLDAGGGLDEGLECGGDAKKFVPLEPWTRSEVGDETAESGPTGRDQRATVENRVEKGYPRCCGEVGGTMAVGTAVVMEGGPLGPPGPLDWAGG